MLVSEEIEERLSRAPNASVKEILGELQQRYPGVFADNQLRTLQRRVKAWRLEQVSVQVGDREEHVMLSNGSAPSTEPVGISSDSAEVLGGVLR